MIVNYDVTCGNFESFNLQRSTSEVSGTFHESNLKLALERSTSQI